MSVSRSATPQDCGELMGVAVEATARPRPYEMAWSEARLPLGFRSQTTTLSTSEVTAVFFILPNGEAGAYMNKLPSPLQLAGSLSFPGARDSAHVLPIGLLCRLYLPVATYVYAIVVTHTTRHLFPSNIGPFGLLTPSTISCQHLACAQVQCCTWTGWEV